MAKNLRTLILSVFALAIVIAFAVTTTSAQCGTYFKPGYRVPNKIGPGAFFGSPFALNDWTGDGRPDFWNFRQTSVNGAVEIVIYPALAAGYWNWDAPIVYSTNIPSGAHTQTVGPVVLDFDGDGRMDLLTLTSDTGPRIRRIYHNTGSGSLQAMAPTTEPSGGNVFARQLGYKDINGDGKLDWLYFMDDAFGSNEAINYALQNADGSFGPFSTIVSATTENEVNNSIRATGDFDGDGKVDIAYQSNTSPDRRIRLLKNMGNATFELGAPQTMSSVTSGVDVYDFNNDGRDDILTLGSGHFVVYYGQSNGTFTSVSQNATNSATTPSLRVADLNGDGFLDIVNVLAQSYETYMNTAGTGFTGTTYMRRIHNFPFQFILGDFTGDGKADIWDSSHLTINAYREEVVAIYSNVCQPSGMTKAMDFDSTSPYDFALWNSSDGAWRSVNGNWPESGVLFSRLFNWGTTGDVAAPGDFDGDNRTDYAVYRNSEGNWYVLLSGTNAWAVTRFGLPGDIPIPNDYDGGGKTDIAVFRPSDGNWYIWFTETQQSLVVHWGSNGDRPVPADYDGDGKIDIGVFRPSTGDWYYVRSSDQTYGIIHWGTTGDVPLPADYDGDAKADLAVFRAGTWYILRSSNNSYSPINWGTTGDVPMPFIERGEIAFPMVYRPSTSRWYHNRYPLGDVVISGGTPVNFGLPNN